jgi:hypothetical protein
MASAAADDARVEHTSQYKPALRKKATSRNCHFVAENNYPGEQGATTLKKRLLYLSI